MCPEWPPRAPILRDVEGTFRTHLSLQVLAPNHYFSAFPGDVGQAYAGNTANPAQAMVSLDIEKGVECIGTPVPESRGNGCRECQFCLIGSIVEASVVDDTDG